MQLMTEDETLENSLLSIPVLTLENNRSIMAMRKGK